MAQFIHLAAESNRRSIVRNGIKVSRTQRTYMGVFAHPQTESFVVSHQWMRELKRFRGVSYVAVRFRIPDAERVWIGKYNDEHINVSASEAVGIARAHVEPLGLEVIIPRPIRKREVESIYAPPKANGWRYYPAAKGKKPCGCPYCQRGEPFSKDIRQRYGAGDA
jgi:hypothetical protein